ncbi:hypothetical protein QBC37DRAFT_484362 [Rhypophila decipiens]|uniref:Uncharacterized protein n=1 Tax=Rhypophila decipiens TaxID=261697 RepID=A0AAN6Y5L6_9PEZI|nr:hypothetical protein QBC37DRAFT_484362 [Rhypophila decipiens]
MKQTRKHFHPLLRRVVRTTVNVSHLSHNQPKTKLHRSSPFSHPYTQIGLISRVKSGSKVLKQPQAIYFRLRDRPAQAFQYPVRKRAPDNKLMANPTTTTMASILGDPTTPPPTPKTTLATTIDPTTPSTPTTTTRAIKFQQSPPSSPQTISSLPLPQTGTTSPSPGLKILNPQTKWGCQIQTYPTSLAPKSLRLIHNPAPGKCRCHGREEVIVKDYILRWVSYRIDELKEHPVKATTWARASWLEGGYVTKFSGAGEELFDGMCRKVGGRSCFVVGDLEEGIRPIHAAGSSFEAKVIITIKMGVNGPPLPPLFCSAVSSSPGGYGVSSFFIAEQLAGTRFQVDHELPAWIEVGPKKSMAACTDWVRDGEGRWVHLSDKVET